MVRLSAAADAAAGGGFHVPGVYQRLLEREREHKNAEKSRQVLAEQGDRPADFFARSKHLLEALETGQIVVVAGFLLGGHSVPCGDAFREYKRRLDPRARVWIVTPNDVVRPAPPAQRLAYPGGAY